MHRLHVLIACALLATFLSACDDGPKRKYVALGDSYAAAPGIGGISPPAACRRSKNNYPHRLADKAGLSLTDVTCSGAPTDAVVGPQDALGQTIEPQIEAVGKDTDLVTMGFGFNDFGLSVRVFIGCLQLATRTPEGTPCADADRAAGANGTPAILDQMEGRLVAVVDAVRERAPETQIVLVGYPTIFPEKETCKSLGMAAGDLPFLRQIVDSLNSSLQAAATARDATYIDLATPTRGHDICAADPWVAGIRQASGKRALAWHPYEEEQELAAELIAEVVE